MSWTDPCSNCGEHRADCECGDWNGYEARKKEKEEKEKVLPKYKDCSRCGTMLTSDLVCPICNF